MSVNKIEKAKRPLGLTIISVLWFLGMIFNLLGGLAYGDVIILILALLQICTIYGLWTGKSWSYILFWTTLIFSIALNFLSYLLMYGPISIVFVVFCLVPIGILWAYLRQAHVKRYLGLVKEPLPQSAYRPMCPNCNAALTWIPEYNKWHCTMCLKWYEAGEPVPPPPPPVPQQALTQELPPPPALTPRCPKCKHLLGWMPEEKKWYCGTCQLWYTTTDVAETPGVFHVDTSLPKRSNRNVYIGVCVGVLIICIFVLPIIPVTYEVEEQLQRTESLIDDNPSISLRDYKYYKFYIDISGKDNNIVYGNITEIAGFDINFFVLNEANFNLWKGIQSSSGIIVYLKTQNLPYYSFTPDQTGYYYFILDNTYSYNDKSLHITATWKWTEDVYVTRTKYESLLQLLLSF